MRDLNLGPETRRLIERWRKIDRQAPGDEQAIVAIAMITSDMSRMLERWMDVAWCWHDASPARVCGGPHVRVKYQHDRMGQESRPIEIIEPADKVGETFPDVPYTIIK